MGYKRQGISPKLRFEVFKKDKFTCQYCGRMAPEVILEVDHIKPVAEGGTNDIINLVTSCKECNSGKGKRELPEESVFRLQEDQIKELAERKEQLEQMIEWRKELISYQNSQVDNAAEFFETCYGNTQKLTADDKKNLEKVIKRFSFNEVIDAIEIASKSYSFEEGLEKIPGICWNTKQQREEPWLYYVNYIMKVLKKYDIKFVPYLKVKTYAKYYIQNEEEFKRFKSSLSLCKNERESLVCFFRRFNQCFMRLNGKKVVVPMENLDECLEQKEKERQEAIERGEMISLDPSIMSLTITNK